MSAFDVDWSMLASHFAKLATAFAIALPLGWDRERTGRSAGLRTFPLVSVSACAYVLVASAGIGESPEAQARVLQGLITGIGFVGGGAILKSAGGVWGTATATSIWATGAIGAAVGHGRVEIALLVSLVTFGTLRWLRLAKKSPVVSGEPSESDPGDD